MSEVAYPGHLGLRSMQERAAHIGAQFNLESAIEDGTLVTVSVPHGPARGG